MSRFNGSQPARPNGAIEEGFLKEEGLPKLRGLAGEMRQPGSNLAIPRSHQANLAFPDHNDPRDSQISIRHNLNCDEDFFYDLGSKRMG